MSKMTMHEELEVLRIEVEQLRKQKQDEVQQEQITAKKKQQAEQQERKVTQEKVAEIKKSVEDGQDVAYEKLNELMDSIKKDYENLSPVAAVVLFALGAAFGRSLSSNQN